MFTKITTFVFSIFMVTMIFSNYSPAQTAGTTTTTTTNPQLRVSPYPYFTVSPIAGVIFPIGELGNNYQAGFTGGLDIGMRVNKEVAIYLKFGYYSLTTAEDNTPNASYIEISAGPRYIFTDPKLKSNFFMEAGVGAYIFNRDAFVANTLPIEKESHTSLGVNVGPGASLELSDAVDIILKSKYHAIFTSTGGTRSFVSILGGLEIRF